MKRKVDINQILLLVHEDHPQKNDIKFIKVINLNF